MYQASNKFLTNSKNSKVITEITNQLESCDEFVISVAFITYSGVVCILEALNQLRNTNIRGKILTGCYLNFTEPKALEKLLEFDNIELRVLDSENFHAKGFFFRNDKNWRMMIGSSNLTQSALTINNEWNLLFEASNTDATVMQVLGEFDKLFKLAKPAKDILEDYRQVYQSIKNFPRVKSFSISESGIISPNAVQEEALGNLKNMRMQGLDKALIISATGTGKTFLSAFDVAAFKPERCLFIVHRTNIAIKAKETFSKVIKKKSLGLYTGSDKSSADYLFATIQTLKNPSVLAKLKKDDFDYIIIDEVHHAEAQSYKRVLEYFQPKFLLGMTATPERTDDADIFKLFDYNIAYEIRLHQALEQDFLCPFHYFAIEDFFLDSEKVLAKDFSKLVTEARVEHIIKKMDFYGYSGDHRCALMFVSNVEEAKELSLKLTAKGIKSKALTSQDSESVRETTILGLESSQLEVIVTVDIFNEGVDIPCVNQVVLLRPTQSAIVYIQQLGRGLRKFRDKKFVVVLDFIANYENNFLIPVALSGDNSYDKDELKKFVVAPNNYLAGKSTITFSSIAKELIYKNIQKTNFSQLKNIKRDYKQLKKELGRIPSLADFEKYNFISSEVILSAKDTYYDILLAFKEVKNFLSTREYSILKFISKEFTPAKRLYEILILEILLESKSICLDKLEDLVTKQLTSFDKVSFENALKHLSLEIFKVNAGRQDYEPLIFIDDKRVFLAVSEVVLQNEFLYAQIKDLIAYNKLIYSKKYSSNASDKLALYSKYSKKDIAHLLNQDYTNGGVNLSGYRVFDSTALLFMTFDEEKKFTYHDNKFVSRSLFTYFSKKGKSLADVVEGNLATNNYKILVFARVNKNDEYMYMGLVAKCQKAEEIKNLYKVVKYTFQLKEHLTNEIWQYFKAIYKSKN
ncbi:DNA helicase [Candidatus Francisella endociliophora]|uniref:DNA helicase n=1 Tax=Candidatus Francisella endociliophora TaxID=653937 RepID=A0A097EQ16_9GAMM|nr:DUF3427 domain-containing protein [Francisella sp. FSC1006]AIT09660.1 DNA helicase [Francisella sp. FSC1006]